MRVGTLRAKMRTVGEVPRQVSGGRAFWEERTARVSLACFRRLDWLVQMEQGREAGQPGGRDGGQRSENVGSPGCADV